MTERERKDMYSITMPAVFVSLLCLLCVKIFLFLNGRKLGCFCFRRSMTITRSRDLVWWNSKQPGCGCRVMETLPCGNGWKLKTTGGAARTEVLDSWPLTFLLRLRLLPLEICNPYRTQKPQWLPYKGKISLSIFLQSFRYNSSIAHTDGWKINNALLSLPCSHALWRFWQATVATFINSSSRY